MILAAEVVITGAVSVNSSSLSMLAAPSASICGRLASTLATESTTEKVVKPDARVAVPAAEAKIVCDRTYGVSIRASTGA